MFLFVIHQNLINFLARQKFKTISWKVKSETIKLLKQLLFKNKISEYLFNLFEPVRSVTQRFYGLPKIYKETTTVNLACLAFFAIFKNCQNFRSNYFPYL